MVFCGTTADEKEPRGFVMVSAARGPVVIFAALFASVAINEYAISQSGCDGLVAGTSILSSSFLPTLAVAEGVINALAAPFMGAFADLTPHRKAGLGASIVIFSLLVLVQGALFLSQPRDGVKDPRIKEEDQIKRNESGLEPIFLQEPLLWNEPEALFALAATVVVQVVTYEIAALLTVTYSAELSTDPVKTTSFISHAYTLLNGMQLATVVIMTGLSIVLDWRSFQLGAFGAFFAFALTMFWFVLGFPKLGARREVAKELDSSYFGLSHIWTLLKEVFREYRQCFKLLISWSIASASLSSITTLSTTYLQFHLGYDGQTVSILLGLALLFSVPRSLLTKVLVKRFDVKRVYCGILVVFGLSFIAAPIVLVAEPIAILPNSTAVSPFGKCDEGAQVDEDAQVALTEAPGYVYFVTMFFTALWGIGIGSVYVANTSFYSMLIPGAKEASYFGIKVLFAKAFTWLPPLLFSLINEAGELQWSILTLAPFFLVSAAIGMTIDEEKGVEDVKHTLHLRRGDAYKNTTAADQTGIAVKPVDDDDQA